MFSGEQVYVETLYVTLFAWLTNYIVIGIAWFNRDLQPSTVLEVPRSYDFGRLNYSLTWSNMIWAMMFRSVVYAAIMYGFVMAAFPIAGDLPMLGSSMYMCLVLLMTLRQGLIAQTFTWVVFAGFIFFFAFYPIAISVLDLTMYDEALIFTMDWPTSYQATTMAVGVALALEYTYAGFSRLFWPNDAVHVLMEHDRGYGEASKVPRPTLHGLRDARAAFQEGNKEVFVLPAKKIAEAFAALGKPKKGVATTSSSLPGQPDTSEKAYATNNNTSGPPPSSVPQQFGTRRSGFDFAAPEGG
jgi:hypothetical protein